MSKRRARGVLVSTPLSLRFYPCSSVDECKGLISTAIIQIAGHERGLSLIASTTRLMQYPFTMPDFTTS